MTCERSEFATNAYKYSASVASFERMSNLFIRNHIRKHIRLCVRAALGHNRVLSMLNYRNRLLRIYSGSAVKGLMGQTSSIMYADGEGLVPV